MSAGFGCPEQKRPLGTPQLMLEDSIKWTECVDRICLAQGSGKGRAFVKRILTFAEFDIYQLMHFYIQ